MVSGSIALLCSRFFSPFLHSTGSLSVSRAYLALRDGPREFSPDFSCPEILRCQSKNFQMSYKGLSPASVTFSKVFYYSFVSVMTGPITPILPKQHRFGLIRVRSPLLAESFLFSFPAGIEMFQFPALASLLKGCQVFYLTGCPIRTSGGQWLFAPYPSFSQLITSFVAPESLGILHAPLLTVFLPHTGSVRGMNIRNASRLLLPICQCTCVPLRVRGGE